VLHGQRREHHGRARGLKDTLSAAGRPKIASISAARKPIIDAAPVRKLINMVFFAGHQGQGSDIHFEPFEDEYKMRYRSDACSMKWCRRPPPATAISSRIKVMANLDIAERRLTAGRPHRSERGRQPHRHACQHPPTMFARAPSSRAGPHVGVARSEQARHPPGMLATFRTLINKPTALFS